MSELRSTTADELWDAIGASTASKLRTFGDQYVEEVRERISTPIERVPVSEIYRRLPNARGVEKQRLSDSLSKKHRNDQINGAGYKVLRSVRGEPPRLETGKLQESIESEVIDLGGETEVVVYSACEYAGHLEGPLLRPILTDLADNKTDDFLDAAIAGIEGD